MPSEFAVPGLRLALALLAGSLIGLERTYHGRPAGFRTHALVCVASTLLMFLTVFNEQLAPGTPLEIIRLDPTRMAQGIMTGIGFLGAGVILKEGLTIRGLTTAASIWLTAAIGIIIGVGMYVPAIMAEVIALGTLALFRWIEPMVPSSRYGRLSVRLAPNTNMTEAELVEIIARHNFSTANPSYHLNSQGLQYDMTIRTRDTTNFRRLSETLKGMEHVSEFSITLTID